MPSSSASVTLELPEGKKGKLPAKGSLLGLGNEGAAAAVRANTAKERYEVCIVYEPLCRKERIGSEET
jgi:hypothetical protein